MKWFGSFKRLDRYSQTLMAYRGGNANFVSRYRHVKGISRAKPLASQNLWCMAKRAGPDDPASRGIYRE